MLSLGLLSGHWTRKVPGNLAERLLTKAMKQPLGDFIARFDPNTGLFHMLETIRYQGSTSQRKILWLNENLAYCTING